MSLLEWKNVTLIESAMKEYVNGNATYKSCVNKNNNADIYFKPELTVKKC